MSPTPHLKLTLASYNRRRNPRFAVATRLAYVVGPLRGKGMTRNISSEGICIEIRKKLPVGRRIHLLLEWPARLDADSCLQVSIEGRILRSTPEHTAVKILHYEYRVDSIKPHSIAQRAM